MELGDDATVRRALATLDYVAAQRKRLNDMYDDARAVIEDKLRDNEVGEVDGQPVVTWKKYKETRLSQKVLDEQYPGISEKCKVTTEKRRFVVLEGDS